MPFHLGFDTSGYPGDSVMQSLISSTPLEFVGFYLAPAPSHPDTGWMSKVATLRSMGWGLAPIYVGQQAIGPGSHTLTAAQGTADAANAVALASSAGLLANCVIYLDVEAGGTQLQNSMDYITAWVAGLQGGLFSPGVYCSFSQTAAQISAAVGQPIPIWVYNLINPSGSVTIDLSTESAPDPSTSGFPAADVWQYKMSLGGPPVRTVSMTWTDASGTLQTLTPVDLDASTASDPSTPTPPASPPPVSAPPASPPPE